VRNGGELIVEVEDGAHQPVWKHRRCIEDGLVPFL